MWQHMEHKEILAFWFEKTSPEQWFKKSGGVDRGITEQFIGIHATATRCELYPWREEPLGRLAEIIVLDQFSRNIHRGRPAAFASDPLALALAQEAIAANANRTFSTSQKLFLFLPFMHSESHAIHEVAVELFNQPGMELNLEHEHRHKAVIDRFGRYPHRNKILGRKSTAEELEFLKRPNSSF